MPEFQTFLTPENMDKLFGYFHWLLFFVAPLIMIWIALSILDPIIKIIKSAFVKEERNSNDDDDDYDFYRY